MWLNLAEVQVTLSAHIKVYPLLQEQNKPSVENRQKKMRRWEAEETGDVLNIKKEQNATKDEAITRQERRKKCWSKPSRELRILKSSSWQHISVFICVQMKGHWQTLMVSSMKPACWPCGLIICLETESLCSHFSDGLLHSMKYIKLLLELSASVDLCTVHRSTHGNKELFIVQEKCHKRTCHIISLCLKVILVIILILILSLV